MEGARIVATLTGRDAVGITSGLAKAVSKSGAQLVDVRQTVVRKRLTLVLELHTGGSNDGLLLRIIEVSRQFKLSIDFDVSSRELNDVGTDALALASSVTNPSGDPAIDVDQSPSPAATFVLTLLSDKNVDPACLQDVTQILADRGFCTESVTRLSADSLRCLELVFSTTNTVSGTFLTDLRRDLYSYGKNLGIDVALQAESVLRRSKRLVVMDMDSTLIQQEVIDEIARYAGVFDQVKDITHRAMNGELDFNQSLSQRVALLKGTPVSVFDTVINNLVYTDGAHMLCRSLKKLGYRLAVISGGFRPVTRHVRHVLGLDYDYANQLEAEDGCLTGRVLGPVVNAQRKADLLMTIAQKEGITLDQCVAIGDGSNDLPMLGTAGLGIAFNAKPAVQAAAKFRINQPSLESALYLLGFSEEDQRELARVS